MEGQIQLPGSIAHWPIERLRPYERNPRTHSAEQVAKFAARAFPDRVQRNPPGAARDVRRCIIMACVARVAVVAAIVVMAVPARADIYPSAPRGWRQDSDRGPREDWQQNRLLAGGGIGVPTSFPVGWRAAAGWSFALVHPCSPWGDVVMELEAFNLRLDDSNLRARGATAIEAGGASFSDGALGIRLHGPASGWQPCAIVEVALPAVSRPDVTWQDAAGGHRVAGTDIFGIDPGCAIAAGLQRFDPGRLSGVIEARLVIAPGRTEPTEICAVLEARLSIPLPW